MYKFKGNISEIKNYKLCLGNISKDVAINNVKKTILGGVVNFSSIDFDPIIVTIFWI